MLVSTLLALSVALPAFSSPVDGFKLVKRPFTDPDNVGPAAIDLKSACNFLIVGDAAVTFGKAAKLEPSGGSGLFSNVGTYTSFAAGLLGTESLSTLAVSGAPTGFDPLSSTGIDGQSSMPTSIAPSDATLYAGPSQIYINAESHMKAAIKAGLALPAIGQAEIASDRGFADPRVVPPQLYTFAGAANIPSLNLVGCANDVWIFRSIGAMDFNPNVVISLSAKMNTDGTAAVCNPPLAKNIFFVSGGAFTTGAACTIVGNVLANGAITAGATNPSGSTTVTGSLLTTAALTVGAGVLLNPAFTSTCYTPPSA